MNDLFNVKQDFYQRLSRFVMSKIQNRDDAEEITQDILVKVLQSQQFKTIDNLSSWTFSIAKNAIIDFYRLKRIDIDHTIENIEPPDYEDREDRNVVASCLIPLINLLPKDDQSILLAVELGGLSQKEYAQQEKIPYPTAKSKVQRARKKLKAELEKCCHLKYAKSGIPIDCDKPNNC